jgi:hypothetical protein
MAVMAGWFFNHEGMAQGTAGPLPVPDLVWLVLSITL